MSKKVLSLVLALVMVLGSFSFVSAADYNDVTGTVYAEAVDRLSLLGILEGYPDGTFKPEGQITRAEFATVAVRARGLASAAAAAQGLPTGFSDVPGTFWASGVVGTAARLGIVNGVGNGQFAPQSPVKYEDAITMLVRALGYEESAKAKGGYPYGYLIVANEIGLLDEVKGTQGAPATRGIVAQMTDNALEIEMMIQVGYGTDTKWVVSGTENTEEKYLLDELGFDSVTGRVVSVNTKTDKLVVDPTDEDLKNVTLETEEGFDFYSVEGLETKFWYKDDVVVIYVVKEEAKFDAVEVDDDELTLITEDENYEVARNATLTLDGKKVDQDEFEADYAKVVLNDDDEIIWAQGYTFDGFILVEEVEDLVALSYDDYDEIDLEDFTIVKEGKTIEAEEVEEQDILFFNNDEEFAVVANKGTEGELDRVYTDGTFRFEGSAYSQTSIGNATALYFDEGKIGELTADVLDEFLDDEATITVYVDFAGDVVVVSGEVSSVGNSSYGVLLEDTQEYTGRRGAMIALDLRNGANEKVSYDITEKEITDGDIKLVGLANVAAVRALVEGQVLKVTVDKDGDISAIELPEAIVNADAFDFDDANVKADGVSYKLQASTIVFYDGNDEAVTLGNAKDKFEEVKAGSTIYVEKGRVIAVVGVTDTDADTKNVTGLVTGVKDLTNGKLQFTVKVFGETQRLVTEAKNYDLADYDDFEDHIVTFKVGETSGEIKDIADNIKLTRSEEITITKVSGRTINDYVELNTKAKIYDAADDFEELNLRDLKKDMVVVVYFQGSSNRFIDYVVVGAEEVAPVEETGLIEKSGDGSANNPYAITVDDSTPYFLNAKTVLRNADNKVIATGATAVFAALTDGDKVEVTVDGDVMTIKRLATAEELDDAETLKEAKEALAAAKDAADDIVEAEYTEESYEALTEALKLPETTLSQINAKTEAINDAIEALEAVGQTALDEAIEEAEDLVAADYTIISYARVLSALELPETTNAQVVAKTKAINDAIKALVFAGQAALDVAVEAAEALDADDYTEESFAAVTAALELPETTNAEVVAKTEAINDAIDALVDAE